MKSYQIWRWMFLHLFLDLKNYIPRHPAPIQKLSEVFLYIYSQCWQKNFHYHLSFFGVWLQQKNIYLFIDISIFCFVLVHTQEIRESNYCIVIYIMRNHHFTWMSVVNCLIGIFNFLKFNITITYNDSTYIVFSLYTIFY